MMILLAILVIVVFLVGIGLLALLFFGGSAGETGTIIDEVQKK